MGTGAYCQDRTDSETAALQKKKASFCCMCAMENMDKGETRRTNGEVKGVNLWQQRLCPDFGSWWRWNVLCGLLFPLFAFSFFLLLNNPLWIRQICKLMQVQMMGLAVNRPTEPHAVTPSHLWETREPCCWKWQRAMRHNFILTTGSKNWCWWSYQNIWKSLQAKWTLSFLLFFHLSLDSLIWLQHLLSLTREQRVRIKHLIVYASCVREGWYWRQCSHPVWAYNESAAAPGEQLLALYSWAHDSFRSTASV